MMHSDSRVKEPVCLATTSLPDPCLSTYLSPRFREEPIFVLSRDGATGFPVKVTHASQFLSSKRQTVNAKLLRDMDL